MIKKRTIQFALIGLGWVILTWIIFFARIDTIQIIALPHYLLSMSLCYEQGLIEGSFLCKGDGDAITAFVFIGFFALLGAILGGGSDLFNKMRSE